MTTSFRWPAVINALMVSAMAVMLCPPAWAQATAPRTVLVIHWGPADFPGSSTTNEAIRTALRARSSEPIELFIEYLESDRLPSALASSALREYLADKYQGRRIDVVVASAEPAVEFALSYRTELFPDAPIVSTTVAPPDEANRSSGAGLTGVVTGAGFAETLDLALRLHPRTERVLVVAQSPGGVARRLVQSELDRFATQVELTYVTDESLDGMLQAVRDVTGNAIVLYVRQSRETAGAQLFPAEIAPLVAQVARVPVYGVVEGYLGTGIVGGVMYETRALGERIGTIVRDILDGRRAADMPIETVSRVPIFDWRAVQRWGIHPALLPATAVVRFQAPTPWQTYRPYVMAGFVLIGIQGLMIAALFIQRSRRRRAEARQEAIMRAMPDMMFLQTREGVFVDYHVADHERLLAPPEYFIGRHMRDVLPPELAERLQRHFATLFEQPSPVVVEYALPFADGDRHYEARMLPCDDQVLTVVRDITERRRGELQLRVSQERYLRATAAGGVGVWDWSLESGEVYVDASLKDVLGYQHDELADDLESWLRIIHPDDVPELMARARDHASGQRTVFDMEHRMMHRDGSTRWFHTRGSVQHSGRAPHIVGTSSDVTDRKLSELALQEAQSELARVSRLTALGEFAASIAHEVRQPLTAILVNARACVRLLAEASPDLIEVRAALADVVDAARRTEEMIRRNRELFTMKTVQKTAVDLNALIREVAVLASARLHANHVKLTMSLADNLPTIRGDAIELQQVLLNLLTNSVDALMDVHPRLRRIEVSTVLSSPGFVTVVVSDNGVGLTGVDIRQMFTLSYTTKPNGSGVGLSISRSIVEAHGGELWAEPNPAGGATFAFRLPTPVIQSDRHSSQLLREVVRRDSSSASPEVL